MPSPYYGSYPNQNPNLPANSNGNQQFQYCNDGYGGRSGFFGGRGSRGGRSLGRGGRGYGRSSVQCQICYKPGHDASYCYYRLSGPPQFDGYGAYGGGYGLPSNVWMHNYPRPPQPAITNRPSFSPQFGNQRPQVPQAKLAMSPLAPTPSMLAGTLTLEQHTM
ncbi:hypothetical protein QL285_010901 [Trifolium repens]|nr:hypothetical protein QL285_010901 [Trifolium repens]